MPGPQQLTLFGADASGEPRATARRLVQLGTRVVEFRFARSRRRTIGISIDADGLAVAAPYFAPWVEIERFLLEKTRWILKKLDEWSKAARPLRITGSHGEAIPLHGRPLTLELSGGARRFEVTGERLILQLRHPHERPKVRAELVRRLKLHALETLTHA